MKKFIVISLFICCQICSRGQDNPVNNKLLIMQLQESKSDSARISLLIKLGYYYIVPRRIPHRIDSVNFYITKARQLNGILKNPFLQNKINLLAARLRLTLFSSDDPKTLLFPIIADCQKVDDKSSEARAWYGMGFKIEQDPSAYAFIMNCYRKAQSLAREAGDNYLEWKLQLNIGYIHTMQKKFDLAENDLLFILKQQHGVSSANTMYTYDRLSFLFLCKGEINKALEYALKTQQMMGSTGDSTSADFFYRRMTVIYRTLGKDTERHYWAKKQLEFVLATNDIPGVYNNIANITSLMREESDSDMVLDFILRKIAGQKPVGINDQRKVQEALGNAYSDHKNYGQAEKCYLEMIRLGNLQNHNFPIWDRAFNNYTIGRFYYDLALYSKARPFLEMSLTNYDQYSVFPLNRSGHQMLFTVDSSLGNYQEAISHLREADRIGDSIFKVERNRQVEELQIAYHTEQKDKNIRLLDEKEKSARLQLKNSQNTRNWITAAALLLLIIATLLFKQGLARKRSNRTINNKNKQLQELVTEKEWLVKEIHHRVKNNLQTVMSLLGTQSSYLKNEEAINAINDSQLRLQSMSLIHQRLYQTENLSAINMNDYIHELANSLSDCFNEDNRVRFRFDIQAIELDLAHAIPLGLIMNEAITNSFKYAFPGNAVGTISVSLKNDTGNQLLLEIKDNGVGLTSSFRLEESHSMGCNLMYGLCQEIGAAFKIYNDDGTCINIRFACEMENKRKVLSVISPITQATL